MRAFSVTFERIIETLCKQQQNWLNIDFPHGTVSNSQNAAVPGVNVTIPFLRCHSFWFSMTLANSGHVSMFNY